MGEPVGECHHWPLALDAQNWLFSGKFGQESTRSAGGQPLGRATADAGDARALVPDPPLLLLDEPSAGLAPDLVEEMFDHIDRINERGVTVLIVEQNAKTALRRCDRGYVLAQGENRYTDDGDALLSDPEVRQQFLGG